MQNELCETQETPPETPLPEPPRARRTAPGAAFSPDDLAAIGRRMFGKRHWRVRMSEALGVERSTVGRWASGRLGMSGTAARLIRELDAQHRARKAAEKAYR